ncbi:receptor-interacting serine/threonine-protein kinase 1 [Octopus bimaculoides]|uniref:Death domain-containing protein n=1 Tax=Octopus bimaculoides TaxID=37653 RepID=A0A0L8HKK4_OCTBM|nr:receptor-interacting serine/threonine-protein kinase 1 [Octopus bimaculoides]|eukprot:XP_014771873.1 PREDICTED: receptor-interacting serine/threonine-protein kinase 1-like [Octopus bimaculoides]
MGDSSIAEKPKCESDNDQFSCYLKSNTVLTEKHLTKIAKYLAKKWKSVGRNLGIENADIDIIQSDNVLNTEEQSFQMLNKWLKMSKPEKGTTGNLAKALIDADCHGAIPYLPLDEE